LPSSARERGADDTAALAFHVNKIPISAAIEVAAAAPPDLSDRAKHLLNSANVGEAQGSAQNTGQRRCQHRDHRRSDGRDHPHRRAQRQD